MKVFEPEGPDTDEDVAAISEATKLEENHNQKSPKVCFRNSDHFGNNQNHEEDQLDDAHDDPGHQEGGAVLWSGIKWYKVLSGFIDKTLSNRKVLLYYQIGVGLCALEFTSTFCRSSKHKMCFFTFLTPWMRSALTMIEKMLRARPMARIT